MGVGAEPCPGPSSPPPPFLLSFHNTAPLRVTVPPSRTRSPQITFKPALYVNRWPRKNCAGLNLSRQSASGILTLAASMPRSSHTCPVTGTCRELTGKSVSHERTRGASARRRQEPRSRPSAPCTVVRAAPCMEGRAPNGTISLWTRQMRVFGSQ